MWKAIPAKSGISRIALHICIKIGTWTFKYMLPQINQYTNLLKNNFYQIYAKYHTGMFIVYTTVHIKFCVYNILQKYFATGECEFDLAHYWIYLPGIYLYMFDIWHCILFGIRLHLWLHSAINTKQNTRPNLILSWFSF